MNALRRLMEVLRLNPREFEAGVAKAERDFARWGRNVSEAWLSDYSEGIRKGQVTLHIGGYVDGGPAGLDALKKAIEDATDDRKKKGPR